MKNYKLRKYLASLAAIAPLTALAGPSAKTAKDVIPAPPPQEPAPLWNWFAGASAGYLLDFEEDMYHGHIGVDLPVRGAWRHSIFAEVGWTETDESFIYEPDGIATVDSDLDILPVTLNYKLERDFSSGLNVYFGAGAGIAYVDYESTINQPPGFTPGVVNNSGDDTVFAAQIFAGLGYDVTPNFEVYGGARWIYIDDADTGSFAPAPSPGATAFDDDVLIEAGLRYNF